MSALPSSLSTAADPEMAATVAASTATPVPKLPPAPREPRTLAEAGLGESQLEALVLKHLLHHGNSTGTQTATNLGLTRLLVDQALERLRDELLVGIKNAAGMGDYLYQLSEAGFARANQHLARSTYVGTAPVPLASYEAAIRHQSIQNTKLSLDQLTAAFADLRLSPKILSRIAQAINDGRGMFLFGNPGNGKTTIAERICDAFGEYLWIPRMVYEGGDLIRLFDPNCHHPVDLSHLEGVAYDRRWVLIRRPTVVVGGELTLEQLDASYNAASGISEAPVQMKANGGALVIDDFGRQRVSSTDILNRLIVPLEKQFDFLNLASGRQLQIPFDMLFALSTNLEPRELVDEAFLRRIPYKIEVDDPTEEEFRSLIAVLAQKGGFLCPAGAIDYLIEQHYQRPQRPLRFCQPRDLLRQIKNYCEVHELPLEIDTDCIDVAVENYFATL
ncbi:AAA family ATPase [Aeoliella sp. ICT_H6.2]|uniref:AAA family ATPase n=1 Tax=Aeoliella straminimaris TaxID=2954799 RepID=A0A9X2FDP3_9BACT|nr:AAA family ATPase [Aeoliella straminimaris]MCO6047040.1 AAA family ATPase [Aeoliella straminimaris]